MTTITYIKSSLNHSSALTTPAVALSQFGLWDSIKRAFKKYAKPIAMIAGIALSIAVPFIAPAVAGFVFAGSALATGAIGAAIAGAGMGAAAGALTAYGTGQNVLMGAALGGLGGGLGGGLAGYSASGGAFLGAAGGEVAGAAGTGLSSSAANVGGVMVEPTSAAIGGAATSTVPGQVGMPTGLAAAGTAAAPMSGMTQRLLEASLKAAPGAIGSIVSGLSGGDAAAYAQELQAEMKRVQNSDINAYNQAKLVYDQLYARVQQLDPVMAAQLAEADVQSRTATAVNEAARATPRGASSADYNVAAETRRAVVEGAGQGSTAYTNAYYTADNAKTQGLASLAGATPTYSSRSADYLYKQQAAAEGRQAGLAGDVSSFLTPYALALAPKDTTLTSEDEQRRRAGLQDKSMTAV